MKNHLSRGFICVLFLLLVSQGSESAGNKSEGGMDESACSAMGNRCLCRRPRRKEQSLTCTTRDCMEKLPTDDIPDGQVKEVVSLLVTRQRNLTRIGSYELRRLGNIRHIRIVRCRIKEVEPNAFVGLNYVERLDLHRNDLSDVPSAIRYLRNLKSLNLGGNHISFIKHGAFFPNIHLERLILGRNYITQMPTLLPTTLVKLSINKNELESLDGVARLTRLRRLNAARNKLQVIPDLPKSLRVMNFCSNLINQTISLAGLPDLKVAILNHNLNLGHISLSTFYDVDSRSSAFKLVTFEARNSGVTDVDTDAFSCLPRLQSVDLAENSITDYHGLWFAGNKRLRSISISGNNFRCDCDVTSSLQEIAVKFSKRRNRMATKRGLNSSFTHDFDRINCSNEVLQPCENFNFRADYCFRNAPSSTTKKTTTMTTKVTKSTTSVEPSTTTQTAESNPTSTTMLTTISTTEPTTSVVPRTTARRTTKTTTTLSTSTSTTSTSTTTPVTTTTTTAPVTTTTRTSTAATSESESDESETTPYEDDVTENTPSIPSDSSSPTANSLSETNGEILIPPIEDLSQDTQASSTLSTTTSSTISTTTTTAATEKVKVEWCSSKGEKCYFPFTYRGKEYTECAESISGAAWCSLTADYASDGRWDYCQIC